MSKNIINSQVKVILESNVLGELLTNINEYLYCVCHKENHFYKKRSGYDHVGKLKEWYKDCSLKNYTKVNKNNCFGFIKMLLYKESQQQMNTLLNNFILRGKSKNEELYIVESDSYPCNCKTVFDMMKKNEKILKNGKDINIKTHRVSTEWEEKWNFETLSLDMKTNGTHSGKSRTIYCFVIVENYKIKCMSDFFSLISFKQLCKRKNDSMLELNYKNLTENKENDFNYYVDSFFQGYASGRKYQKYEQDFLFMINFYNIYPGDHTLKLIEEERNNFKTDVLDYLNEIKSKKIEKSCTECSDSTIYSDIECSPSLSVRSDNTLFEENLQNSPSLSDCSENTLFEDNIQYGDISQSLLTCNNTLNNENADILINDENNSEQSLIDDVGGVYYGEYLIGMLGILKTDKDNIYLYNRNSEIIGMYDRCQTMYLFNNNIINVIQCKDNLCIWENSRCIGELLISEVGLRINISDIYNSLATSLFNEEELSILIELMNNEIQSKQFQFPIPMEEQTLLCQSEISNTNEILNQSIMPLNNLNSIQLFNFLNRS